MRLAVLGPYRAGALVWRAPELRLTVVVKLTFSLARDGQADIHLVQVPVSADPGCADEPCAADEPDLPFDEPALEQLTDEAPYKPRADLIVTGHAYSAEPVLVIPIRFEVDGRRKQLEAVATTPSCAIPLVPEHLRSTWGSACVGPRAPAVADWAGRCLPPDFDFERFNVAPPDQCFDALGARPRLTLQGLLPRAATRAVWLPNVAPTVHLGARCDRPQEASAMKMRADTIWVHTDRELCTVTWRGVAPLPRDGLAESFVAVGVAAELAAPWARVAERFDAVLRDRPRATQSAGAAAGARPDPTPAVLLPTTTTQRTAERPGAAERGPTEHGGCGAEPTLRLGSAGEPAGTGAIVDEHTVDLEADPWSVSTRRMHAVPFVTSAVRNTVEEGPDSWDVATQRLDIVAASAPAAAPAITEEAAPVTPRLGLVLGPGDTGAVLGAVVLGASVTPADAVPYRGSVSAPPPSAAPPRARRPRRALETVTIDAIDDDRAPPTPFHAAQRGVVTDGERAEQEVADLAARAERPSSSWPPPHRVTVERALDLRAVLPMPPELYARIRASIEAGTELQAAIAPHGLSEKDWRLSERRLAIALAKEQAAGRADLSGALRDALETARTAAGVPIAAGTNRSPA